MPNFYAVMVSVGMDDVHDMPLPFHVRLNHGFSFLLKLIYIAHFL